jgi:hypothetical protein
MGLDYSIRTYVKKEKFSAALKWLLENTNTNGEEPVQVRFHNETSFLNGYYFKIDRQPLITGHSITEDFTLLAFVTSLVFDIDPKVIASVADNAVLFSQPFSWLEDFKKDFEHFYLGNGKISIGGFDTYITKMENDVYEMVFMAVTSDLSRMIAKSIAVKKWIVDFSEAADAIFSYVDMEDEGRRVYYYKGRLNLTLHTNYDTHRYPAFAAFFDDYRALNKYSERPPANMYVRDHIKSYIKQEMLPACLQWLRNNSWSDEQEPFPVPGVGDTLHFSTSLIFDIDSVIIDCVQDLSADMEKGKDFKNTFESIYLQNGKVKIGPFKISLIKLRDSDIYKIVFRPVFGGRSSWLFEKSLSVKKWILEFSLTTDSILCFLDQDFLGHRILYYKGHQLDFMIHDPEEIDASVSISDFFTDCYALDQKNDE